MPDYRYLTSKIDHTKFSPLTVHYAIAEPLRYLFSFVPPPQLRFHEDPKETKIVISSANDKNLETALQGKPRILINRGTYEVRKVGLTDNMAEVHSLTSSEGVTSSETRNSSRVHGACTITVEASEEGVCELLTDMVHHFIVWSRPHICNAFGFQEFGLPMQVSEPAKESEDVEKYKTMIRIPYLREDSWSVKENSIPLKGFIYSLVNRDDC